METPNKKAQSGQKNVSNIDKAIGAKINHLRLAAGITRQELAERVGITHQQLQKYEKGINRVTAGRLLDIAHALNIAVSYFFEEFMHSLDEGEIQKQRMCMEVMRDFNNIPNDEQKEAVKALIRVLAK